MLCTDELRMQIATRMGRFERLDAQAQGHEQVLKAAAVAIVVTDVGPGTHLPGIVDLAAGQWSGEAALMLTRRAQTLRNHAGQWAFPGGRVDPGESLIECALREMHEEVGVVLPETAVIGLLDDFVTRSGFCMTPVLVWGGEQLHTEHNPAEVASVHRIPLEEFMRADAPMLDATDTSEEPILRMPVGDDYIAAPTAALIYQFREVALLDRQTRVGHFEQPEFAWR